MHSISDVWHCLLIIDCFYANFHWPLLVWFGHFYLFAFFHDLFVCNFYLSLYSLAVFVSRSSHWHSTFWQLFCYNLCLLLLVLLFLLLFAFPTIYLFYYWMCYVLLMSVSVCMLFFSVSLDFILHLHCMLPVNFLLLVTVITVSRTICIYVICYALFMLTLLFLHSGWLVCLLLSPERFCHSSFFATFPASCALVTVPCLCGLEGYGWRWAPFTWSLYSLFVWFGGIWLEVSTVHLILVFTVCVVWTDMAGGDLRLLDPYVHCMLACVCA